MLESILTHLEFLKPHLSLIIISFTVWLTYFYSIRTGSVSDDIPGIMEYDGKRQGWEYGHLWRWVRYHIVGGNFPSSKTLPDGTPVPLGKIASRHHFLSILVFNLASLVAYTAFAPVIGQKVALMAILILIVHPCTTQGVAWISGLAYPLSLFWISIQVILLQYFYSNPTLDNAVWVIPVFCLIQWLAIHAIFATTAMSWALLLFLGYWHFALLSFIISAVMCLDEIRKIVSLRVSEFKKQHMEESTVFHWRKFIVAMKTLGYYVCLSVAPMKMGLYHVWGFHYSKSLERMDKRFIFGFSAFLLLLTVFFKTDIVAVKLGILWYLIFSTGFWNWITAQQFVTERYILVANFGFAILLSVLTQDHFAIYTLIIGLYLMRTWLFLPTYDNELRFYQSNHWNFPDSEVALGNLGVTYARLGLVGSAKDSWTIAAKTNPDYDVPWVNIFYQIRTEGYTLINNGDYTSGINKFKEALPFLQKTLGCKVCHFPEQWRKEYEELSKIVANPVIILQEELKRLLNLRETLKGEMVKSKSEARIREVRESIINNNLQMDRLVAYVNSHNLTPTDMVPFGIYETNKLTDKLTGE